MANNIVLNTSEREIYGKALTKAFVAYIRKRPNKTPMELIDILYTTRKNWFDHLSPDDLDHFNKLFEKISRDMDIDLHWGVSVKYQLMASNSFNNFIDAMKRFPPDSKRNKSLVATELNLAFGREFGTGSRTTNIMQAFEKKPQLKEIGKRLVKELGRMGYAF